jgi:nicotinate phosphoribosyltransferase
MNKNLTIEQIQALLETYPQLHSAKLAPALSLDRYQLTTIAAHFDNGTQNEKVVFDYYFRKSPFYDKSFAFAGGLQHFITYIQHLKFMTYQINLLRSWGIFSEEFLEFLRTFEFTGNIKALREGTLTGAEVRGARLECTVAEAHFIETWLLNNYNPNTLWLTLAVRMLHAAKGGLIWEGGMRRAQGIDASIESALMGYIAGMQGTSNVEAVYQFGIPSIGTHPHAWVQFFDSEYDAFLAYYRAFPQNTSLLIDTFDVLKSGVPNAIKIAKLAESEGNRIKAVRIDSGDLAYLTKETRRMLDEAGLSYVGITLSDGLNRKIISSLVAEGVGTPSYLVGTDFVTSAEQPALGGVFKLVAVENKEIEESLPERWKYRIKISSNPEKTLLPGIKKIVRIINNDTNKHVTDLICSFDEVIDESKPLQLTHPVYTSEKKMVTNFRTEELLQDIFVNGKLVYEVPSLEETRTYVQAQKTLLWDEQLRETNPSPFWVNISDELLNLRSELIEKEKAKIKA